MDNYLHKLSEIRKTLPKENLHSYIQNYKNLTKEQKINIFRYHNSAIDDIADLEEDDLDIDDLNDGMDDIL